MSSLRKLLLLRAGGGGVKLIDPSANSSFNVVGIVDLREQGGCSNRTPGTGAVYIGDGGLGEPTGWGGWCFNRV